MNALKGVLAPLVESGKLSERNITLEQARIQVLETIEGKGKSPKDRQQIVQMVREVQNAPTVERLQSYVFNSYLKFNGQGVI